MQAYNGTGSLSMSAGVVLAPRNMPSRANYPVNNATWFNSTTTPAFTLAAVNNGGTYRNYKIVWAPQYLVRAARPLSYARLKI